jgi:hypothetical protein
VKASSLRTLTLVIVIAALSLTLFIRERRAARSKAELMDRLDRSWPLYVQQVRENAERKQFQSEFDALIKRTGKDQALRQRTIIEVYESVSQPHASEREHESLFDLLPGAYRWANPRRAAVLALGYSSLEDVVVAVYHEYDGPATWRGFFRPYASSADAGAVMKKYVEKLKNAGAEVREVKDHGADEMVLATVAGSFDAVFRKGNTIGGASASSDVDTAETFARRMARNLPKTLPSATTAK